ncbi:hypothetical protein C8J56DRAFT_899272 [Mycena floridula]|nr:hypothetical protein C8J56DRAFT_899272 [Mycena floridula]
MSKSLVTHNNRPPGKLLPGNTFYHPLRSCGFMSLQRDQDNENVNQEDEPETEFVSPRSPISCAIFKLHKIVQHVRVVPQHRQNWLKQVNNVYPPPASGTISELGHILILDVKTRWSSTHQMLHKSFSGNTANSNSSYVVKDPELCEHELEIPEWEALELITKWLKDFRLATAQMSTTKQPMISTTHAIFHGLQAHVKKAIKELPLWADDTLKDGLINAHQKLSDYFYKFDQSQYYTWAALLDPRIFYESLHKDYQDENDLLEALEMSKVSLQNHFDICIDYVRRITSKG